VKKDARTAPVFLLAGGQGSRRSTPDPLLRRVFEASGRADPSVAYVGAASGDNREFFASLSGYMRASGAGEVSLVRLASRRPDVERARGQLESADVVFLSGGDVEQGMAVLEATGMDADLRRLFGSGKPFFGLSAGSIMLADRWVRWTNPDDDATAAQFGCLGIAPVLVDTHGEADGWGELRALLALESEGAVGFGIPTAAGLRVEPDGAVTALGGPVHRFVRGRSSVERVTDLAPA
jgi:cyanophycinase-like exopeptidase